MKIDMEKLVAQWSDQIRSNRIDSSLYATYNVKRGLRDTYGNGVLAGLTKISAITAMKVDENGDKVPCEGNLAYRGYDVRDLINGAVEEERCCFEECAYLLLFGKLPTRSEIKVFNKVLAKYRELPVGMIGDVIFKNPSKDLMNTLMRGVLDLYNNDDKADDISIENVLNQSLMLIAAMPLIAVYGYQSYTHHFEYNSLVIHTPLDNLSTAENVLRLLRLDGKYTKLEAQVLDLSLILHADHGGGNNSTFTTHVVSSSGTDTYSSITASLGSLKGPRHGGANVKVVKMFDDLKANVKNTKDPKQIEKYVSDLLEKKAFDKLGLVYGIGHAIYSLSDPRADILKQYAKKLCDEKGLQEDYELYEAVAQIAPALIGKKRRMYKGVSANVDFYSGLIYKILGIPYELFTPLFAIARISGWCAHRMEEIINDSKIIRPAYKHVIDPVEYVKLDDRNPL